MRTKLLALSALVGLIGVTGLLGASRVSADTTPSSTTYVSGYVKDGPDHVVSGANVHITCVNHTSGTAYNRSDVSSNTGHFSATYPVDNCAVGDSVTITADAPNGTGRVSSTIDATNHFTHDVFLITATVAVPEFTPVFSGLAAAGAIGAFALKRRQLVRG